MLWYDLFQDALAILAGQVQDDTTLAFVAKPDEGDDLDSELTWQKVNPGGRDGQARRTAAEASEGQSESLVLWWHSGDCI